MPQPQPFKVGKGRNRGEWRPSLLLRPDCVGRNLDGEVWFWALALCTGASLGGAGRQQDWAEVLFLLTVKSFYCYAHILKSQVSTVPPGGELGCSLFIGRPVFKAWGWRAHSVCAQSGFGSGQLAFENFREWFCFSFFCHHFKIFVFLLVFLKL